MRAVFLIASIANSFLTEVGKLWYHILWIVFGVWIFPTVLRVLITSPPINPFVRFGAPVFRAESFQDNMVPTHLLCHAFTLNVREYITYLKIWIQ